MYMACMLAIVKPTKHVVLLWISCWRAVIKYVYETFLAKQDLEGRNSFHKDDCRVAESTTDLSTKTVRGRISGGVV